ncbi:hypothetical protein CKA32_001128 [Geitlerinema sp. FC II]|nr:hypothetical protein CKA32_001128 [Geitlerinema sp. FC II]
MLETIDFPTIRYEQTGAKRRDKVVRTLLQIGENPLLH